MKHILKESVPLDYYFTSHINTGKTKVIEINTVLWAQWRSNLNRASRFWGQIALYQCDEVLLYTLW